MNLFKYFQFFPLVVSLVNFIRQAQAEFKGTDTGEQKFNWVVNNFTGVVEDFANAGLIPQRLADAVIKGAPQIVEIVVQLMKVVHGAVPPAEPVPVPAPAPAPPANPPIGSDPTTIEYSTLGDAIAASKRSPGYPNVMRKPNGKFHIWQAISPFGGDVQVWPS